MKKYDVVVLTESRYLEPTSVNEYVQNILTEDELLKTALERQGLTVCRKNWADPSFDWTSTRAAIFRTTWDYFDRFKEFKTWLSDTSRLTQFINPISQIRWNMDKWYLQDLQSRGISVVETRYVKKGTTQTLSDLIKETGWDEVILKPTIAGTARHTYRLNASNTADHEEIFQKLIVDEDMMIQPFQMNIVKKGEISMVVIAGKYSHSVLKKAKQGDFRVQDDFGGSLHDYTPTLAEQEFAQQVVSACDTLPAYARVDVMWDNNDALALSELEIIEPELWFRRHPEAADSLAREVIKRL